jgi:hypothetical protein
MQGLSGAGAGAVGQNQAHVSASGTGTDSTKRGALGRSVDSHDEGKCTNVLGYCSRIVDGNNLRVREFSVVQDARLEPLLYEADDACVADRRSGSACSATRKQALFATFFATMAEFDFSHPYMNVHQRD